MVTTRLQGVKKNNEVISRTVSTNTRSSIETQISGLGDLCQGPLPLSLKPTPTGFGVHTSTAGFQAIFAGNN
jgi:hypothetical protein